MKIIYEEIAKLLLEIEAVQFSIDKPFKWSSGWNSPIYCDCRLSLSFPNARTVIKKGLVKLIKNHFTEVGCIAGVATAGIPQGALIADSLNIPFVYVRSKPKDHGKENLIEGKIIKGQKTVVVEDIISTGQSTLQVVKALKEAGFDVLGVVAIYTYGFDFAHQNFQDVGVPYYTLCDYHTLLVEIAKKQDIDEKTMASLHAWRKNPESWSI